jgi:hypothetical protein
VNDSETENISPYGEDCSASVLMSGPES